MKFCVTLCDTLRNNDRNRKKEHGTVFTKGSSIMSFREKMSGAIEAEHARRKTDI